MNIKHEAPYDIAFETVGHAGYIKTVRIVMGTEIMDSMDTARVDLAEHPLYPWLVAYVKANPPRRGIPSRMP